MTTESKSRTAAQIRDQQRFDEQCYLLDHFDILAKLNRDLTLKSEPYQNFNALEGEPGQVIHQLVGKKGIEDLFTLKPVEKALIMPQVQISKVKYKSKDQKNVVSDEELVFTDHTSPRAVENIFKGTAGRGDDVGLKSFEYEFTGKNPAEGGLARCSLKIFFQNIEALIKREGASASFIDLLVPEAREVKSKKCKYDKHGTPITKDRIWNPKFFRIKIVAGWAMPQDPSKLLRDSVRKALDKSKTILFLQLLKHEINFRPDGSVELTAEYQGAVEGALVGPHADLLAMTEFGKIAKSQRDKIVKQNERRRKAAKAKTKSAILTKTDKDDPDSATLTKNATEADRLRLARLAIEAQDKQIRYSRIISALQERAAMFYMMVGQNEVTAFNEENDLGIKLAIEQGLITSKEAELASRAVARRLKRKKPRITRVQKTDRRFLQTAKARETIKAATKLKTEAASQWWPYSGLKFRKQNRKETTKVAKNYEKNAFTWTSSKAECKDAGLGEGCKKINFFFLGSLFEIILSLLKTPENRADALNVNVLLGPIVFKDPRNPSRQVSYNLADIPISLNLFLTWYMRQVVAPQRDRYYVGQFIKDVITKLVIPALGEQCFGRSGGQRDHISLNYFTLPSKGQGTKNKSALGTTASRVNLAQIKVANKSETTQTAHQASKNLQHFIYIYVSSWPMSDLKGDYNHDAKRGIYHLTMGSDRGLVKNIVFKKNDQPYVAEMRATTDTEDSKRLRDRYNATVTMIGNNLFRNGMYVFIDTALTGLGRITSDISIARQLGLGGYYQITKVSSVTSNDTYETELECEHIALPTSKTKTKTKDKCVARQPSKKPITKVSNDAEATLLITKVFNARQKALINKQKDLTSIF